MSTNLRRLALIALLLAAVVIAALYATGKPAAPAALSPLSSLVSGKPASVESVAPAVEPNSLPGDLSTAELQALLDSPRVRTYFQREREKQALAAYFGGRESSLSAAEVWELIGRIEADGRMLAYEALALKLEWLEHNSADKGEFDAAAAKLVAEYRQRALERQRDYDPYRDVPGFADYKAAERRIVAEVQQMREFPAGQSRQEYLRKRLLEARQQTMR